MTRTPIAINTAGVPIAPRHVTIDATAPSVAATTTVTETTKALISSPDQMLASDLIGTPVYDGTGKDAERIGEIDDVVLSANGATEGVIIGVGGFLGIGEKDVAISFDRLEWADREDGPALTTQMSQEELEAYPAYDRTALRFHESDTAENSKDTMAPPVNTATRTDQPTTMGAKESAGEPVVFVKASVSASDLLGTTVLDAKDESIGEVGDVIVSENGDVEAYIVDVGGFLGIGEKPVALDASQLDILKGSDGSLVVRTSFTEEELSSHAAYSEKDYKSNPDAVILR